MLAITVVFAGIENPLYVSDWDVQWNNPIGVAGAQRKTSFITHPRYGKAA
jgi:hypothetical protein